MRFMILLAVTLLVSGCGSTDTSNATDNVSESVPSIQFPRAGRYKVTDVSEIFGKTPGVPGKPTVIESCLPDQTERDLLTTSGMSCTPEEVKVEDGDVSAIMRCSAPGTAIQDARLDIRGSYSAKGADVTWDVVMPDGMLRLNKRLERIGDC